jgi:predicted flap endonuclease-1-like 5' DNA nuclease
MAQKEKFPGEGMIRSQKPSVVAAAGAVIAFLFFMLIGPGWILSLLLGVAAYFLIIWLLGRSASSDTGEHANETHAPPASSLPAAAAKKDADVSKAGVAPGAAAGFAGMSAGAADQSAPAEAVEVVEEIVVEEAAVTVEASQPLRLEAPRDGNPDDLKKIKGVGPKLEGVLHGLGYYHFDQIAAWTPSEIAWVDENIEGFSGRATRDDWVDQAKLLAGGGETEFSERVDKGEVY